METCLQCNDELEFAAGGMYARCKTCRNLFMNVAGTWQAYPVDASMKPMIEQALGFAASASVPPASIELPSRCLICQGTLEIVRTKEDVLARCPRCGNLSCILPNGGLQTIVVQAPGGGWNPEFQAIFEEKLGFAKKIRRKPIGIPE